MKIVAAGVTSLQQMFTKESINPNR
ncbi:hypothetical protein BRAS3843_2480019 [Bradyrhizobium sp. STM 3843]|nr:hypothetical protein BRAS3843_2480019 [Bradyrhizobium sp. STM 3843]